MWWMLWMFGCRGGAVAPGLGVDAAPPLPVLFVRAEPHVIGEPLRVQVELVRSDPSVRVSVFASDRRGLTCQGGECIPIASPLTLLGRFPAVGDGGEIVWDPVAPFDPGDTVHIVAVATRNGAVVATAGPAQVELASAGCTFDGSPNYDPRADVDDGSCVCQATQVAHNQAEIELARQRCAYVQTLELTDFEASTADLSPVRAVDAVRVVGPREPAHIVGAGLERVGFNLSDTTGLTTIDVEALRLADTEIRTSAALSSVQVRGAYEAGDVFFYANAALTSISMPDVVLAGELAVQGHFTLHTLDLGALRLVDAVNLAVNPLLREPQWGALGGAAQVRVSDNAALTTLNLRGLVDPTYLTIDSNPALVAVDAPDLERVTELSMFSNAALEEVQLPALVVAANVELWDHARLTTLGLPALRAMDVLGLEFNPALASVDLGALLPTGWVVIASQNRALCLADVPSLYPVPPGCELVETDHGCPP